MIRIERDRMHLLENNPPFYCISTTRPKTELERQS